MEETASYFVFAERWGWTPDQVDALPVIYRDRLPVVAVIHDEVQEARQKDARQG